MKKTFVSLLLACMTWGGVFAQSSVVADHIDSRILSRTVKMNVYLPDGYQQDTCHYPVVYLLHGLSDDHDAWAMKGNMQAIADSLIVLGQACKMVIVMPQAGESDVHNVPVGYFNMPDNRYEDFFFGELMGYVEGKYRVVADKKHRAIMGLSMGGGGSTVYSQRHPELFSSCYCMSGWLDQREARVKNDPDKIDMLYRVCEAVKANSAIDFVANADKETINNLKSVKWFFDCGDDDYLLELTLTLHSEMKKNRIRHELRVRNGAHNWKYWQVALTMALPFATENFTL